MASALTNKVATDCVGRQSASLGRRLAPLRVSTCRLRGGSSATRRSRSALECRAVIAVDTNTAKAPAGDVRLYTQGTNYTGKPRVVVLGSGWGAVSFIKSLSKEDSAKYDIVVVSPRNYFLYTPLLPAVATGTMEERSIVEPVRKIVNGKGNYFEAMCQSIDAKEKTIVACFPKDAGTETACFKIPYDILVVAVGSVNNTFGVKGVNEHCFYFKSIEDANNLRRRISESFERAALPQCGPEERKELLSFVLVGGGPTGVEVAAEIYDVINEDLSKLYPELMQYVSIKIVDLLDHVLSTYDRRISEYAQSNFQRAGIELILNTRVQSVSDRLLTVVNKDNEVREIPFGTCVWATGIAKNPLIESIQEQIDGQSHVRSIVTDGHLRVVGSDGSIFALGDASTFEQRRALEYAEELFDRADKNRNGRLCLTELRQLFTEASKEFPQFEEFARFFDGSGSQRWGRMVQKAFAARRKDGKNAKDVLSELSDQDELTKEEFYELLKKIDNGLRALPATAQVARQQGEFLARVFSAGKVVPGGDMPEDIKNFEYYHKGSLAYVGKDNAVIDLPVLGPIWGFGAGLVWKSFETYSQFSLRNQFLVATDWARTKIFGRDISRF